MSDDEQPAPVRYVYKASIAGSPHAFELAAEGLAFQTGFRSGVWRYGDIAQIRLTYRPVSMLAHRFRADLRHKDGRKLALISASFAGIVTLAPQDESYRTFIEALHRRLVAERSAVVCLAGLQPVVFAIAAATFLALMVALAGLMVRALMTGEFVAALFLVGFAAWCGWYSGGWLMRNKPYRYDPAAIPRRMLP